MDLQLHDPAFLAVASGGTPALDLFFSATKALDSRITFTRGSSGTFINENGNVVGKTPSTTSSITPSTTAIGSQVTVTVASGSVVGWVVGQAISLIVDTDGQDDPDAGELWLLGDIVSSTLTTLTFTVTSRTATAGSATSWTLGYRGPRFTHNPTTLASLGLLVEESRVNLLLRTEEIDNASWSRSGVTITQNAGASPDGAITAESVTATSTGTAVRFVIQSTTKAASAIQYAYSFWAKAVAGGRYIAFTVDDAAGNGFSGGLDLSNGQTTGGVVGASGTFTSVSATQFPSGWWKVVLIGTSNTSTGLRVAVNLAASLTTGYPSATLTAGDGIFLWGLQLEAGAFATSYIKNVDTALGATRAADVVTMTGSNFSSWYNQSEGTLLADFTSTGTTASKFFQVFALDGGSNNSGFGLVDSNVRSGNVYIPSFSIQASFSTTLPSAGGKAALAYKTNDFAASFSGGTVQTDTSGSLPTSAVLYIGNGPNSGQQAAGTISRIRYFRRRLPDANLQTLTT